MEYIVDGRKFDWSYSELRGLYHTYIKMTDKEFLANIPAILHFTVFACFVKEIPGYVCLSDTGIVHELVHILNHGSAGGTTTLKDVRRLFKTTLKFA